MPVKIRLQRHGKKGKPYFHIVVADARAPRDGKYIERLGFYNPNTDPATIDVDVDGAVKWLGNGAQPTDTAKAILSYKGVLYKNHLMKGVSKGAFDEAEAEKRFDAWMKEKAEKIEGKRTGLDAAEKKAAEDRFNAEVEKNKARAAAIAEANRPEPEPVAEATDTPEAAEAAEISDTPSEEAKEIAANEQEVTVEEAAETVAKAEEKVEEKADAKAEPAKEEEKKGDEPKAEAKMEEKTGEAEAQVAEAKAEPKEEPKATAEAQADAATDAEPAKEDAKDADAKDDAPKADAGDDNAKA